ncbi:sigma-B regulation protein RsbU (phosphoserine phosphatase) [Saccharothrix tamanrassetensis]|uniref:Sigma-B regulation protein RsbU (Phosphoserine phosphatase) n=1 Tax=Saccharothrix tamanrassetensis TaxID=1051531 RepID=A0A841CQA4_9PSEU|nr:SpoIIE family protein phosphatase [Saccharothrix tamanrassetensis]MBB5958175.1 sigma-B regulation protein RsbU (phosphoserine phosphatase) [Saccharothrix tamanrassetensis]
MCQAGDDTTDGPDHDDGHARLPDATPAFSALLEDSAEDLYEHAPCGYLSTLMDGTIAKVNATLLDWLGYRRDELVGRRRFSDLLTVGGRIYHETHIAPSLSMHGRIGGLALELRAADGSRLPVLMTSVVKTGVDGSAQLVRTTVFDARDRRAYERELLRARDQADLERDRAQKLASTLQRTLVPPILPTVAGMEVDAYYHPASNDEVGGDFYDLFPLADDTWGFFLGDVSGKGAAAAVVTSLTRYTLRAAAVSNPDPVAVLHILNTVLNHEYQGIDPRFCTVVYGLLTREDDGCTVALASGGHPPAALLRADGTAEFLHIPGGQLVGALPDAHFAGIEVRLRAGDALLLYSDGLTEARTGGRVRHSEEELLDFLDTVAPTTATALVEAVKGLLTSFGDGVDDDTALLALSIPSAGTTRR